MGLKKGFLLTAAVLLACFSMIYSQPEEITFNATIKDKDYDGNNNGEVVAVAFYTVSGNTYIQNLKPYDKTDPQKPYDYKIESVIYDYPDAGIDNNASVKITLNNTMLTENYIFADGTKDTTLSFNKKINKAKAYIAISCQDVIFGNGNTPTPVIDTMNLYYDAKSEDAPWISPEWCNTNLIWRYALMDMEQDTSGHIEKPDGEADPIPAWMSIVPQTRGTYWVQAIFNGNDNYLSDTSKFVVFGIADDNSVSIKNNFVKQKSLTFAGIRNGEINLSLKADFYTIEIYNLQGRRIAATNLTAKNGINATGLKITNLSRGMFILNVKHAGVSVLQNKIMVK